MDANLAQALSNIMSKTSGPFWNLISIGSYITGLFILGVGLFHMSDGNFRGGGTRGMSYSAWGGVIAGAMLMGFPSMCGILSQTVFNNSGPSGLSSQAAGGSSQITGDFVAFAIFIITLVGYYAVFRGLLLLRSAGNGREAMGVGGAVVHLTMGTICLNITTFARALGTTVGGTFQDVVNKLLG